MSPGKQQWEVWLERLYNLQRNKSGSHESPHKPVLLLSIIDLLDRGVIQGNAVPLSDELNRTFKHYFEVVRAGNDRPNIEYPFFHLCGDQFWHLVPMPGQAPIYRTGATSGAPSVAELRRRVAHGEFEAGFWPLFGDPASRHQLREALIARYFPGQREALAALVAKRSGQPAPDALRETLPPGRDAAFRRTILDLYDYQCAACGMRLKLGEKLSLVEAAHLIPFRVTRDDRPNNGLALCPNHHWAMDRHLIAPCPDRTEPAGVWRVSGRHLDDRMEGQRELLALAGKRVIPPREKQFYPAEESLRWREEHLGVVE